MREDATPPLEGLRFALSAALLLAALLLGGGQGGLGDTALQLCALPLLAWMLWRPAWRASAFARGGPGWLVLVVVALPLLQLLPIPEALWNLAPARRALAAELAIAGVTPAHRVALDPLAAEHALWGLLPAAALFLSTLALTASRQRRLVAIVLLVALASILLGMLQLADGHDSPLRLYSHTNRSEAVGLFANRNHFAALLLVGLPLSLAAVGQVLADRSRTRERRIFLLFGLAGTVALLILGIALARSRAGLGLGMLGLLLALPLAWRAQPQAAGRRVLLLAGLAGVLLVAQFALFGVLQRFQGDSVSDQRWRIVALTAEAARGHLPFGTGLGGFRAAYQAADAETPGDEIVNHAHNDWIELWLEGGWPFALLAAAFLFLVGRAAWRAWRPGQGRTAPLWARAASIAVLLALLHSLVDYPLRTSANQAVFAVLLGILFSYRGKG